MPQAQPGDYDTSPDQDTDYSNTAAALKAPHNIGTDGTPNGGFDATDKTRQHAFAEAALRGAQSSAQP